MKKFVLVTLAVAFVFGGLSMVSQADNGANDLVRLCKFLHNELGLYDNVGDCVSDWRSNPAQWAAKWCKTEFRGIEIWERFGFKNRGDCISFYRNWK